MACSFDDFPAGHESHGDALSRAESYRIAEMDGKRALFIYFEDEHGAENHLEYRLLEEVE